MFSSNGFDSTFFGFIAGNGGLSKNGSGTLTLNGDVNISSGPITISAGTLAAGPGNLGDGSATNTLIFSNGAILKTLGSFNTSRAVTLGSLVGQIDTNGFDSIFSGAITG